MSDTEKTELITETRIRELERESKMWQIECLRANQKTIQLMIDRGRLREALQKIAESDCGGCADKAAMALSDGKLGPVSQ